MADFEQRSRWIARGAWLTLVVVTFVLGIGLGSAIGPSVPAFARSSPINKKAGEPFDLNPWKYPEARMLMGIAGGKSQESDANGVKHARFLPDLYAFSTTDPLEKVWAHYLKLAGINPEGNLYKSGHLASEMGPDRFSNTLAYVDEPGGQPFRSATLVAHRGAYTVTVFASRADKRTHVELVVQQMPR
jgi:hypothetical protein